MTYIINENCIKCKLMDCVEVCPVDCFYEGENMLVIKPDECIDCGVCEPECPIDAIQPDTAEGADGVNGALLSFQERRILLLKVPENFGFQGARRAYGNAVAAEDACCVLHPRIVNGANYRVESAPGGFNRKRVLNVVAAHIRASPAHHAFFVVTHVKGIVDENRPRISRDQAIRADLVFGRQVLQFDRLAEVDPGGQKAQNAPTRLNDVRRSRMNLLPVFGERPTAW